MFEHVEKAYNFIETGERKVYESLNLISGNLRIGASDTICKYLLAKHLEKFNQLYPNIKIQVTNRTSSETISLLKSGKVDIGFVNSCEKRDNSIMLTPVLEINDCFIAGEKYKHLTNDVISIYDLEKVPVLMLERASQSRKFMDKYFEKLGCNISPELELGSYELLTLFSKIGLGVSCVVKNFVSNELENNELFEVIFKENIPPRFVYLATLKNLPESKIAKSFSQLVMKKD